MLRTVFLMLAVIVACASPPAVAQDPIVNYNRGDRDMNAAIATAQRTLPNFLTALGEGSAERYSVKVPIPHAAGREHIWMTNVRAEGDEFSGEIENEPQNLTHVRKGSPYRTKQNGISDWYYLRDGKIYGAYTIRVMMPRLSPAERRRYQAILAPP